MESIEDVVRYMQANDPHDFGEATRLLSQTIGPAFLVHCEPDRGATRRIIITTKKAFVKTNPKLRECCNGVVLEYPGWDVIVRPLRTTIRRNAPPKNLSTYEIYPVRDGTVVTLYWHNDEWNVSSAAGWDIRGYTWTGPRTYGEIIAGLVQTDDLDINISYTIGFRHPDFHPLLTDPAAAWLIQCYDRTNNCIIPCRDIGLPIQESITVSAAEMTSANERAMHNYLTAVRAEDKPEIHYGYLLRRPGGPDILLESTLLYHIRTLVYDNPRNRQYIVTALTRQRYIILRAFLSRNKYNFIQLFPQFGRYYDCCSSLLDTICQHLLDAQSGRTRKSIPAVGLIADSLNDGLERTLGQVNAADGANIIMDYISAPDHLPLYCKYLFDDAYGRTLLSQ